MVKYVVVDLETTGHSFSEDEIIEIGIVTIEMNEIVHSYSSIFHPKRSISPFISDLTGLTDEDVQDAPLFSEKAEEIYALLDNHTFIAHNVPFDLGFLNEAFHRSGLKKIQPKTIDTVELSRILFPQAPGFKLGELAEYLKITHDEPHRALSDATVTAKLFLHHREKILALPYETKKQLLKLEKHLQSDLYELLQEKYDPFDIDPAYDVFQNVAYRKMISEEKLKEPSVDLSFGEFLDYIYEKDGQMERRMDGYEKRNGQREFSEYVFDHFHGRKHLLIEAGTGVGKTIAYLLPAIYEAVRSNERIIISTYTTQLQHQLLQEEIPLLKKLIPFSFSVALLKGKGNYISLERFSHSLSFDEENYDIVLTKAILLVWLTETETGDIDEIQLPRIGYQYFRSISTESERSFDPRSPWYERSFYQRVYKKAKEAHLIITNHALFTIDLLNEYQYLPAYKKAIIDEAHHFVSVAAKNGGLALDYMKMMHEINKIGAVHENPIIDQFLNHYAKEKGKNLTKKWNRIYYDLKYALDELFTAIFRYIVKKNQAKKMYNDVGRIQLRLQSDEKNEKWNNIRLNAERSMVQLKDLIGLMQKIHQTIDPKRSQIKFERETFHQYIEWLDTLYDQLEQFFLDESNVQIKWLEADRYGAKNAVYLFSEPLDISETLQEKFLKEKSSIIFTSATLTMKNSFSYIESQLGTTKEDTGMIRLDSPYAYKDQVQLLVPDDFPHVNDKDFIYATCEAIISLAEITNGRMLVLFTSYEMLRKAYGILKEMMIETEFKIIAQGVSSGSRNRLKKSFEKYDSSILLGTSSFWEGVDIPGDQLSALVIVRLPFQPPNHPVFEAKAKMYKEKGKNPFFQLSLPHAVLRFKQGFGRLIRSSIDRGIIFVCDARLKNTRYGKVFIDSIPKVPLIYAPTPKLMEQAEKWF